MKSIIRWAGSKRQAIPYLKSRFPRTFRRYIEPFAGSACVFFDLGPQDAILGDLNSELLCTYRELQTDVSRVLDCLRRLPSTKRGYYTVRAQNPNSLSPAEIAARFLYLNHYCFNGLYRTNSSGYFNVPVGRSKSKVNPINENAIIQAARALRSAILLSADFQVTLAHANAGDLVYLDPPYIVRKKRVFSEYLPGSFSERDLERLRASLEELDRKGAKFLLTYEDCRDARSLFNRWDITSMTVRRNIAGFVGKRVTTDEIIVTNTPV